MSQNIIISIYDISDRKSHMQESATKMPKDIMKNYWEACDNIQAGEDFDTKNVFSFLDKCRSKEAASRYCVECAKIINLIHESNNPGIEAKATYTFKKDILPYVENFDNLKKYIEESSIEAKDDILDSIKRYKVCDRINNNYNMINKRFNLSEFFESRKFVPAYDTAFEFCDIILSTYEGTPGYAKMNIALEEVFYGLKKNSIEFNIRDVVEGVKDYFYMSSKISQAASFARYEKVLNESFVIESEDFADSNDIRDILDKYKKENVKKEGQAKEALRSIFTKSPSSIIDETPHILTWIRNIAILGTFAFGVPAGLITFAVDRFIQMDLRRKEADRVCAFFEKEEKAIERKIEKASSDASRERLESYLKKFQKSKEKLEEYRDTLYSDKERERREEEKYNSDNDDFSFESALMEKEETTNLFDFDKFKVFKFQNLVSLATQANKDIAKAADKIRKKIGAKLIKFKDVLSEDSESIGLYIDNTNRFDACIALFDIEGLNNHSEIHEEMDNLCNVLNIHYEAANDVQFYYIETANDVEIRMRSAIKIYSSDMMEFRESSERFLTDLDKYRFAQLKLYESYIDNVDNEKSYNILKSLALHMFNTPEVLDLMYEYANICHIDSYTIDTAIGSVYWPHNLDEKVEFDVKYYIKKNKSEYPQEFTESVDIELCEEMTNELEEIIISEKVDVNSIKLAITGMKNKAKNLSQKEKEISRDIDIQFNGLTKGVEKALTSDRREAIIKGSIIPSFSKCIKTAIVAGTAFVIAPTAAAIGVIGALAVSKHCTEKERRLLMDEIDIELKVVERELSNLDSHDSKSSQKYRSLLTYQQKLQREKQRIKYNMKVNGQAPTGASVGVGKGDND